MKIKMSLVSEAIPGSGEGLSGIIDSDISSDEFGIPYIPSKRIKGVLRESGLDLSAAKSFDEGRLRDIFGESGAQVGTDFKISNGFIKDYEIYKKFLISAIQNEKLNPIFNKESVLNEFTYLRSQTTIDSETGTAKENSLRTCRVLKRGLIFYFDINLPQQYNADFEKICHVTRRFGLSRTRGLGEISLKLMPDEEENVLEQKVSIENEDIPDQQRSKMFLQIENIGQLLVTNKISKNQFTETFIPGSAILGLLANAYIKNIGLKCPPHKDKEFQDIFLNGNVYFFNANPVKENFTDISPTPASITREKDKDHYFDLAYDKDYQKVLEEEIADRRIKDEFSRISGSNFTPFSVDTVIECHHSRPDDKGIGHAREGEGAFFQYLVLKPGQKFQAEIIGPFGLIKKISSLLENKQTFYLGKSKTAQYGKLRIVVKEITEVKTQHCNWNPGERIIITLISDMVLRSDNGFITPDPKIMVNEMAALLQIKPTQLNIEKTFIKSTCKSGFLGVWKLPKIQQKALGAGSVVIVMNKSDLRLNLEPLYHYSFGLGTAEGCGKVDINRHGKNSLVLTPYDHSPPLSPGTNTERIAEFIKNILIKRIDLQLKSEALKRARKSQLPSNSFIGKMGLFFKNATSFEELNEKYLNQLRSIAKKHLEKIEKHLMIKDFDVKEGLDNKSGNGVKIKKVDTEIVGRFITDIKNKPEINSHDLRKLLGMAKIGENFFTEKETFFEIYKQFSLIYLNALKIFRRTENEV